MPIPRPIIAEIRDRVDLAALVGRYVRLKNQGSKTVGLCPFHQEKTPSFHVSNFKKNYHCFGCGVHGDCFAFLMELEGLSFVQAVKELGESVGIPVEDRALTQEEKTAIHRKATLHDVNKAAAAWFHHLLLTDPSAAEARKYLKKRGMKEETIRRSQIGYAPDSYDALLNHLHKAGFREELAVRSALAKRGNSGKVYSAFRNRIMFPIFDIRNRPIAFGGRALSNDEPAKYLNSASYELYDKSRVLYGLNWARNAIQRKNRMLIVEGYFDVLSLHQAGFEEAVASCGTALRSSHLSGVRSLVSTVYALFDGDEPGLKAAEKSLPIFMDAGLEARFLSLPDGLDPDDFIQEKGAEAFQAALDRSVPLLELVLQRTAGRHGSGAQGRKNAVDELLPLLRKVDGLLQSSLIIRCSELLGVSEAALRQAIGLAAPQDYGRQHPDAPPQQERPWVGNTVLNQLLWLLIHNPEAVSPHLENFDLARLSERESVCSAVTLLAKGQAFAEVLDQLNDPDLCRVLSAAASKEDIIHPEKASHAAKQMLAKLEVDHLKSQIQRLHLQINQTDPKEYAEKFMNLVTERSDLQKKVQLLLKIIHQSSNREKKKP
jgi:DNA primase